MINDPNVSDAEIAAQWSIQAVRADRVELAEALFRIAAQAVRAGRPPIRDANDTAEATVIAALARKPAGVPVIAGADDSGEVAAIARQAARVTAIMQAPSLRDPIPLGRRCEFEIQYAGTAATEICQQGVFWGHQLERWMHVDGELDRDHQAYVTQ